MSGFGSLFSVVAVVPTPAPSPIHREEPSIAFGLAPLVLQSQFHFRRCFDCSTPNRLNLNPVPAVAFVAVLTPSVAAVVRACSCYSRSFPSPVPGLAAVAVRIACPYLFVAEVVKTAAAVAVGWHVAERCCRVVQGSAKLMWTELVGELVDVVGVRRKFRPRLATEMSSRTRRTRPTRKGRRKSVAWWVSGNCYTPNTPRVIPSLIRKPKKTRTMELKKVQTKVF